MAPAIERGIAIIARNTFDPSHPGTRIAAEIDATPPVKGVSTVKGLAILNLEGAGMIGVPGTAQRVFSALEQAKVTFGPEIMQAVNRLVQQLQGGSPSGPVQPYLCHTVCEIGGTPLLTELQGVRAWMDAHPTEVVSIFIQDAVSPADTRRSPCALSPPYAATVFPTPSSFN